MDDTLFPAPPIQELTPGCYLLKNFLALDQQIELLELTRIWTAGGFTVPALPNGKLMGHPICGLGYGWKPYAYYTTARPMPLDLKQLAKTALKAVASHWEYPKDFAPDVTVVNWFPLESSLGLHQDRSEAKPLLECGSPIITLSLGCSADFGLGGPEKTDPVKKHVVHSGDVVVMGGPARNFYHSVTKVYPRTAPEFGDQKLKHDGRVSLRISQCRIGGEP